MFDRLKKRRNRSLIMILSICMLGTGLSYGDTDVRAAEPSTTAEAETTTAVKTESSTTEAAATEEQTADSEGAVKNLTNIKTEDTTYCIVLDPGHGGNDTGADGVNSSEKRLNLLIGTYLKEELEQYEHVTVIMTRAKDVYVDLHKRMKIAKKNNADLVVSLHNDSWDPGAQYDNGSSVLVAKVGKYRPEMAAQEMYLARSVLSELEKLGLVNRGLVRKKSSNVPKYENGSKGDYHAIIRDGMIYGIPSILIEHAFCDNKDDYNNFLKSEEQLRALAAADARGIARYLQLRRKDTGEVLPPIEVKGEQQVSPVDETVYFTLSQKRYYIAEYQKMMAAGKLRHDSNMNQAQEEFKQEQESRLAQEKATKEAEERKREIRKKNTAAERQVGNVIWIILGSFVLLLLIREFDFGIRISVRARKRGEIYTGWNHKHIQYNYKDTDKVS